MSFSFLFPAQQKKMFTFAFKIYFLGGDTLSDAKNKKITYDILFRRLDTKSSVKKNKIKTKWLDFGLVTMPCWNLNHY